VLQQFCQECRIILCCDETHRYEIQSHEGLYEQSGMSNPYTGPEHTLMNIEEMSNAMACSVSLRCVSVDKQIRAQMEIYR
jgi:hypothetical protein